MVSSSSISLNGFAREFCTRERVGFRQLSPNLRKRRASVNFHIQDIASELNLGRPEFIFNPQVLRGGKGTG